MTSTPPSTEHEPSATEPPLPVPTGQPLPAPKKPRNNLATAALILCFVFAPVGLVLGIIALVQIHKRGQRGTLQAVIATVWGAFGVMLLGIAAIVIPIAASAIAAEDRLTGECQAVSDAADTLVTSFGETYDLLETDSYQATQHMLHSVIAFNNAVQDVSDPDLDHAVTGLQKQLQNLIVVFDEYAADPSEANGSALDAATPAIDDSMEPIKTTCGY